MISIPVSASTDYNVLIERGLIARVGEETAKLTKPAKAVIVSGPNTYPLYGEAVTETLKSAGFEVLHFIHQGGEAAKSLETYGKLLNFLCDSHVSRSDILVALGGGVTGDLTGFAAATYLRGISFVQIPTTLLAAVDSSVGGKTAINLNSGKNQAGCFYQPIAVFCDPDTLKTLPDADYRCGCAEIVKYGVLAGGELFDTVSSGGIKANEEAVIASCVRIKSRIVNEDEFDRGTRMLLNLGHSIGHAVEKCSSYAVHHGDAVAVGMAMIVRAAADKGFCSESLRDIIIDTLKKYDLPTETGFTAEELFEASKADKKISGGKMHLIVPEKIGSCRIESVDIDALRDWL